MSGGDYTEHDFSQPPAKRPSDYGRGSLALTQSNLNDILAAAAASNGMTGNGVVRNPFQHHQEDDEREEGDEEEEEEDMDRDAEMATDLHLHHGHREEKMRATDSLHHLSSVAMRQMTRDSPPAFRRPSPGNNNCHRGESEEEEDEEMDDEVGRHRASFMPNSLFGGLQFKISKAGISENGEPELVVTMEINNVTYEGSLFAAATKKNLKLHKVAHKHSPLNTSSPVKSTTSSAGSAVTQQMVSPKNTSNGSHHNNNEADMMNNNCVSKNPHFLEPEVQIHSPPSPVKNAPVTAPRIGPKVVDEEMRRESGEDRQKQNGGVSAEEEEEDLSMKPKKMLHMEEMRSQQQPMVSS